MENEELEVYDQKYSLEDDLNTVFSVAKQEYDALIDYLMKKVFPFRKDYENFFENTEFTIKQGIADLDIMLQYSIIELGFRKGHIDNETIETVEGISKYGSLMKELRFDDVYFDWSNFNELPVEKSGYILDKMGVFMSKIAKDFATFFALFQPTDPEDVNFIRIVEQKVNDIINIIDQQNMDAAGSNLRTPCILNAAFRQLIR